MIRRLLGLSLLLSFAQVPPAEATPKIEHVSVKVAAANDEWTPTTIKLAPGDLLVCVAKGTVKVGAFIGSTDPNGKPDGTGALQMKIGTTDVRRVGAKYVVGGEAGVVKLRVTDTTYTDNSGAFEVRLLKIPAELIPEPTVVGDE